MTRRRPTLPWDALAQQALAAQKRAYAPYSHYHVGAALLVGDGSIVAGCNVENSSFGATICAERTALAGAVAQGQRELVALAVATPSSPPGYPCGICLQCLSEFAEDLPLLLLNPRGEQLRLRLRQVLRHPYRLKTTS